MAAWILASGLAHATAFVAGCIWGAERSARSSRQASTDGDEDVYSLMLGSHRVSGPLANLCYVLSFVLTVVWYMKGFELLNAYKEDSKVDGGDDDGNIFDDCAATAHHMQTLLTLGLIVISIGVGLRCLADTIHSTRGA